MSPAGSSLSIEQWVSCLRSGVVASDMVAETVRAFFFHLADLGLFEKEEGGLWRLTGENTGVSPEDIRRRLGALKPVKQALFVPFFLHPPEDLPDILSLKFDDRCSSPNKVAPVGEKASDLSNLQIVKKIGRQLEPFIELEKNFFACVEGANTGKMDAQILFRYLLEKTREKGRPREWEQLSRRRHR